MRDGAGGLGAASTIGRPVGAGRRRRSLRYGLYRSLTWVVWALALPWLSFRRRAGGDEWRERAGGLPSCSGGIWVHAASVGEVAAAAPLVTALRDAGEEVLLSVMTPTGRAAAARLQGGRVTVAFPPVDLPPFVETALRNVSPRALLVVETELWPNLIVRAAARGVRVGIVNGRLSPLSVRRYGSALFPLASIVDAVEFVACRSSEDAAGYARLGFPRERLTVAGSLKFDTLPGPTDLGERESMRSELGARGDAPVVVFGSVRPAEEEAVALAALRLVKDRGCRVVIAPRHLERAATLRDRLTALGLAVSLRSEGKERDTDVLLLDTTGELVRLYSAADVAFVGGTLAPYGGHNPLEPAAAGVPVVIGPHTSSCEEDARALLESGGAIRVADGATMLEAVIGLLDDDAARAEMGSKALASVRKGRGATARIIELMRSNGVLPAGCSEVR